jgi:hypothetical protein
MNRPFRIVIKRLDSGFWEASPEDEPYTGYQARSISGAAHRLIKATVVRPASWKSIDGESGPGRIVGEVR